MKKTKEMKLRHIILMKWKENQCNSKYKLIEYFRKILNKKSRDDYAEISDSIDELLGAGFIFKDRYYRLSASGREFREELNRGVHEK